jgi:hypothetical protein
VSQMITIFSVCRNRNPVLSSFMTYHRVHSKSNSTDATYGAGTAHPSGAPEFCTCLSGVRVVHVVICVHVFSSVFKHDFHII